MAKNEWEGRADAVAQIATGSIDTVDGTPANNTFVVTIGGITVSEVGDTDVATTAAAFVVTLNASTHPYFAAITWANPSAGTITGTADTAGVPFIAALTVTGGGTGTVTDFAGTTVSSGPNDWSTAINWSLGTVPVNGDDVFLRKSDVNISWGIDQNAVTLDSLIIEKTYTGKIGLRRTEFATTSDAETHSTTENPVYLEINAQGTGMVLRCINRETGQRAVGAITAYRTGDHWLPSDKWERSIFSRLVKKLKQIMK